MWVSYKGNDDPLLVVARRLAEASDDECFSAHEVAQLVGVDEHSVVASLMTLMEDDWVVNGSDDWSMPLTVDTRWIPRQHCSVTLNSRYEVLEICGSTYFRILDDRDDPNIFDQSGFLVVESSRPKFWQSAVLEDDERWWGPPQWNRAGFFEDYHDGVSVVCAQFWKDLREFYPETWNERQLSS